jgi:DNA-binding GntR family transcriptional regulator
MQGHASTGSDLRVGGSMPGLNDMVRAALYEGILRGRYRPGTRLVEGRLAAEFGVSRNPVREALKALATEGVVTIEPRRGAIVAHVSETEFEEVIELRAALEGLAARLAARRLLPEAAEKLEKILRDGEAAARTRDPSMVRLNDAFHAELSAAGQNRFLAEFVRVLRTKTQWMVVPGTPEADLKSWGEHAAILRAVIDGDDEMAGLLASRHITRTGRGMIERRLGRSSNKSNDAPDAAAAPDADAEAAATREAS